MSDSTTIIIDPKELRPLIHQTVDALGEADRIAGKLDPTMIEQAIQHHRQLQPCR